MSYPFDAPFVGSEALAAGVLNRHQLRSGFSRICPDVYLSKLIAPTLQNRARAAWLWSQRQAVIAGSAAAALHGAQWVGSDIAIELIHPNPRPPAGVITRRDGLLDGETVRIGQMAVTTPERTAFDVGRRGAIGVALPRMDALMRATALPADPVRVVAARHPGARGLRQLETVLGLADPGAQSPKESWLRLVLIRSGMPRPQTQVPVTGEDGYPFAYLDLGWPDLMVAVEYDGYHHRTDRYQYLKDIRRREMLERMGWIIITVVAGDRPADIVARVRAAIHRRSSVH